MQLFREDESSPTHAITMRVGTILKSKEMLLLAMGSHKLTAVKACIEGKVTPACPVSALQLHANVTIALDKDSASSLASKYITEK